MLFRRETNDNSNGSDEADEEASTAEATGRQAINPRRSRRSRPGRGDSTSTESIFKLPPLSYLFVTIALIISSVILHISVIGSSASDPDRYKQQMDRLHQYNSQLESQISKLKELKSLEDSRAGQLVAAVKGELSTLKSFVSKEVETVSSLFSITNHTIDFGELEARLTSSERTSSSSVLNMSLWEERLMQKLICLHHGSGGLYLYHTRKAAGTTLRDVMSVIAHTWRVKLFETEGISLDRRFVENNNLLSVVTLRHPVKRVMSLYWYEHVGWWHGVLKEIEKVKSLKEWVAAWKDGSKWKTDFVRKNPGTVYVEIENYYVKMLTGWNGDKAIGPQDLEEAKKVLDKFDLVLLVEWMQDDTQVTALNAVFPGRSTIAPGQKVKGDTSVKAKLASRFAPDEVISLYTISEFMNTQCLL
jgi:hypothetical protein